jgi:uncharacterized protein (TIGR03435 family)
MKLGFLMALLLIVLLAVRTPGVAQVADSEIRFKSASVKPAGPFVLGTDDRVRGGPGTDDPGRFIFPRATLTNLLIRAYNVPADQISGPAWFNNGAAYAYSIAATLPAGTTKDQFRLMLQNLLAERFHLRLHHETQTRPRYALEVASGGPNLKEWAPVTNAAPFKMSYTMPISGGTAPIRMTFRASMGFFCQRLGYLINQSNGTPDGPQPRVVDETGLAGTYEFTLEFVGTTLPPGGMLIVPPADAARAPTASDKVEGLPDIFGAVEKQLGLKLVRIKDVSLDVLVVDNADKVPTKH